MRVALVVALAVLAAPVPGAAQVHPLVTVPNAESLLDGPQVADPLHRHGPVGVTSLRGVAQPSGDSNYQPEVGQPGKDVIWVPTPEALVQAMLTVAGVKPDDFVVDLGSGDGRIAIAAARDFGAHALGIEYNRELVALARRNAARAGVAGLASFRRADIFETDFSNATVVTLYLLPTLNLRIRERLLAMRPGTRIVSNAFTMGDWEPERTISTDDAFGYFWIVPARVAGRWAFEVDGRRFAAEIGQHFQQLTANDGGPLLNGRVTGTAVRLFLADGQELSGSIDDDARRMAGQRWVAFRIADGR